MIPLVYSAIYAAAHECFDVASGGCFDSTDENEKLARRIDNAAMDGWFM